MGITAKARILAGAALLATALGAAAPALAQGWGYGYGGYAPAGYGGWGPGADLHAREDRIAGWIRHARDTGRIGPWQADDAWAKLQRVRDDERRARWSQGGGLRPDLAARLNDRLNLLADGLRLEGDSPPPRPPWW